MMWRIITVGASDTKVLDLDTRHAVAPDMLSRACETNANWYQCVVPAMAMAMFSKTVVAVQPTDTAQPLTNDRI